MAFWRWRGSSRRDADGVTAAPPSEETRPLVVFTSRGRFTGWMSTGGRRVTDLLNESVEIELRLAAEPAAALVGSGVSGDGAPAAYRAGDVHEVQTDLTTVPTEEVLMVVPPVHQSARQMQVHRRQRRVAMRIGPFDVEGHAHVTPGVPLDAYIARLVHPFLALTNVLVEGPGTEELETPLPTAIVNVRAIVAVEGLS